MNLKTNTLPLLLLAVVVLLTAASSASPQRDPSASLEHITTDAPAEVEHEPERVEIEDEASPLDSGSAGTDSFVANRWAQYANVCETFSVLEAEKLVKNKRGERVYPLRYRRNRYDRKLSHQRRTRDLIALVAREMGVDREGQILVDMLAHHESSWNPEAIHILNGDLTANQDAWERHSYSEKREKELRAKLKETDARSQKYWAIKAQLADLRMYADNPYWHAQLEYTRHVPERAVAGGTVPAREFQEYRSVWAFGYGLFGMNAVLYTHVFAEDAPPWLLCSDEGIVAVVAAIWALREQQSTCEYLSKKDPEKYGADGGSVRSIIRRWGAGQCRKGVPNGAAWRRLMADAQKHTSRGTRFAWDTVPDFGNNFPKYEMEKRRGKWRYKKDSEGRRIKTDPEAVIAHMREKADAAGILRPEPLKRKNPGTEPVVIATR